MIENEENKKQREHIETLAKINGRKEGFLKSPFWFTVWDITYLIFKCLFWLGFWAIIAQCECKCIIK